MSNALHGIEADVNFDHATCDDLVAFCNATARTIDEQAAPRATAVATGKTDFVGHYSRLFDANANVAKADATELAARLRELATFAADLQARARAEQQRRDKARSWMEEREGGGNLAEQILVNPLVKRYILDPLFRSEEEATPPVGPPDPPPPKTSQASIKGGRENPPPGPGSAGNGNGTSSARPEELRSFATTTRELSEQLSGKPEVLNGKLEEFRNKCQWGTLDGSSVVTGLRQWNKANDDDVAWANAVAGAFEKAGGEGGVATLSNSALAAALKSKGIDATRDDIAIDPAIANGAPPTTGFAVDPVNTATGNFLETEVDLGFNDSAKSLTWARTYNSFDTGTGAFGPGWASWAEAGLEFTDESARMRLEDGRVVVFPRLGQGWGRATGENLWLTRTDGDGYRAGDNRGRTWDYTPDGRLHRTATGPGTETTYHHDTAGRLVGLTHARGRRIEVTWDGDRVVQVAASDGRTATFDYDERGQLVQATGDRGARSYGWDDDGLIARVVDADGVVEVDNEYDTQRRVHRQRTRHGRGVKFTYLDGRTTAVSDEDGTRSNTWLHDRRGRLIGVVDAHEHRQSMSYDQFGNQVMVTERDGDVTIHEHDDRGRRVRTVTPSGADLTFGYDDVDRVTTVVTESGAVTEYAYDGTQRNPSALTDPEGGLTRFVWDGGLLTEVVDPTGVRVRFGYDGHGDLVATTNADGNTARLERDPVGRVTAAITPSGHRTTYTYGADGWLASRRDPDGAVWRFEHTHAGRLSAVIDPLGARTEIHYGSHGDEQRTIDPLGRAITRHLDDLGSLASSELPDGSTWRFTHDALSRLTETIDPTGAGWRHEYGPNGELTATVDPTGVRRTVSSNAAAGTVQVGDGEASISTRFDPLGRVLAQEQADGSTAMATYDRCGRPVELLDAEGGLTKLTRDAAGRVVEVTSPTGAVTRQEYDHCGRLIAAIDPLGARTTREYDADGRVVRVVLPTGEAAWVQYDACGRVVAAHEPGRGTARYVYDAAGRVTRSFDTWHGQRAFRYDAAGQLIEVVNGNGGVTRFGYDANGRAVQITDPLGNTTRREFDAMNRCVAETDPLGRTTRAGYDEAGRQAWQEDPDGGRTEWTYDASGRPKATRVGGQVMSSVERDLRHRTVTVTDHTRPGAVMTHELEWSRVGQLVRRSRDGQGVSWEYDADGRRTGMTTPDGHRTTYTWDAASRLADVAHPLLGRASFVRDASGRLVEASAGGTIQTWEHHNGWVVAHSITDADGSTRTRVERDGDGRVVAIDRDGATTSYDYDEACQLVAARLDGRVHRWTYDPSGRLVAESDDGATIEHSYDAASQLTATRSTDGTTIRYSYDGLGRRTRTAYSDGRSREFDWSPMGWLAGITDHAADQVRHTPTHVDAIGELASIGQTDVWWDSAAYAGAPVLAGDQPVLAAGPVTGVGHHWSAPGWRTARSGQDPWNIDVAANLPGGLAIGAAGELTVGGTDPLEWMGARVYDPAARGFLSVDPLDPIPGAGWAGNPYAYAGNDPLHALDPLGLRPATDADLKAYAAANTGPLAGAREWTENNWEYIAGGAAIVGGAALMLLPVPGLAQAAGVGLIAAGADTIIQKATTGEVNWGQVAISGALGMAGAGATAWAMRASTAGGGALLRTAGVHAGVNIAAGEAQYFGRGGRSVRGALAVGVGSGVSGAIGGAAGPSGGTIAMRAGHSATSLGATSATAAINYGAGFMGSIATDVVNGRGVDLNRAAVSGSFNMASGYASSKISRDLIGNNPKPTDSLHRLSTSGPKSTRQMFSDSKADNFTLLEAGLGPLASTVIPAGVNAADRVIGGALSSAGVSLDYSRIWWLS